MHEQTTTSIELIDKNWLQRQAVRQLVEGDLRLINGTSALKRVTGFMVDDLNAYPAAIVQMAIPSLNTLHADS